MTGQLRRRRRQATQIIRKKNLQDSPVISPYPQSKSSGGWRKLILFFITVVILGLISYYLYSISFFNQESSPVQQKVNEPQAAGQAVTTQPEEQPAVIEHRIQIEILNGCGKNGVARLFQSYLRDQGFDVVNTDNYIVKGKVNWDVEHSFVIDHIGVAERAKDVARSLGIEPERIETSNDPHPIYDVSIVVGKDYKKLKTK